MVIEKNKVKMLYWGKNISYIVIWYPTKI